MSFRFLTILFLLLPCLAQAADAPVRIGLDAEFGHKTSTSDDAIKLGMEIAIDEINARGGVLGGRKLELVTRDNRSVPARGVDNFRELAALPDLVAVFGGKFSPVLLAQLPLAHELKLPLLTPWSAADGIVDHGQRPSYTFRLSVRDGWVMPYLFREAERRGINRVALFLPNGAWGRSNEESANRHIQKDSKVKLAAVQRYEWTDLNYADDYQVIRAAGAQAILFVGNEAEGARLVMHMASMPKEQRLPILSHWGLSGGDFFGLAGPSLFEVDLSIVQSFSFLDPLNERGKVLLAEVMKRKAIADPARILSPVGIAHAYDLTHLLAQAIDRARSTDRSKVRNALENLGSHQGVIRKYAQPFTAENHEAFDAGILFTARWGKDGSLARIAR